MGPGHPAINQTGRVTRECNVFSRCVCEIYGLGCSFIKLAGRYGDGYVHADPSTTLNLPDVKKEISLYPSRHLVKSNSSPVLVKVLVFK